LSLASQNHTPKSHVCVCRRASTCWGASRVAAPRKGDVKLGLAPNVLKRSEAPDRAATVLRETAGFPSRGGVRLSGRANRPFVRSIELGVAALGRPCFDMPPASTTQFASLYILSTSPACVPRSRWWGRAVVGGVAGGGRESHGRASPTGHVQHGVARLLYPPALSKAPTSGETRTLGLSKLVRANSLGLLSIFSPFVLSPNLVG
jgi:hypothetical protein